MASFIFNVSKGRWAELLNRVNNNDPANAALVVIAINTTATDATLKDLDTVAAVLADGNTAEVTNTSYARKVLDQAGGVTVTTDDGNDRVDGDTGDLVWTVDNDGSPNDWTDLLFAYDSDTTGGTDANLVPISLNDFPVTVSTTGFSITAQVANFARAQEPA